MHSVPPSPFPPPSTVMITLRNPLRMFSSVFILSVLASASAASQPNATVVCLAGQCLQGFTNTTIGAKLSAPGLATEILFLPGQYTSATNPELIHQLLTSPSTSVSSSPGFNVSSISSPFNVALEPGLAIFPQALYSGIAQFAQLPNAPVSNSSSSTSLSASSLALSSNIWVSVSSGSSQNHLILWDSVPDIAQLPGSPSLSLVDIQSNACSPQCAGSGVCSASGQCICPAGFTGASCESCGSGFFGPKCQACPAGCSSCDDGISGSGRCLVPIVNNLPSTCNCLNGECGSNGQCTCNAGWTTADNGTACAKCAPGFFLDSNGDCSVCQLGCSQCEDSSGICVTCKSGFTQDANDRTKCDAVQSKTASGTVCPDGSFSNGTACTACSATCQTCSGPTSNDCIICGNGQFSLGGTCVPTDGNGVCQGSSMIANNNKHECDSCPSKCTSCKIPSFSVVSTVDQLQCTGCLPGFVLSQGKCVASCPSGTFLSPQDNLTCTACSSSCGTCAGSADFCLTCANSQLASSGKCVSSCPSNTFSSSGSCITCHPDCATCSGNSFNQCSSCPPNRPVLTNGRCLPTCSKSQFFDTTSLTCQSCDSSCSSCSGAGPSNCLACSSSNQVLRGGSCTAANCNGTSSVIPGLGVCLSDLVVVPQASGTSSAVPLPTITGLTAPAAATSTKSRPLQWWEILLMALGCAFIFLVILMLFRRRMRKKRAQRTAAFAISKNLDKRGNWRWRLLRFGERLFGHTPSKRFIPPEQEGMRLTKMHTAEEGRHQRQPEKMGGPSALPSYYEHDQHSPSQHRYSGISESLYSQVTGAPRRVPDPRQPVKDVPPMASRFSWTTSGSSVRRAPSPVQQTEAQKYAMSIRAPEGTQPGMYWLEPVNTGTSNSKNPFRK